MADSYHLERFVIAQDSVYEAVRRELQQGRKTSHWMWFVFPQIEGLGQSWTAQQFAISGWEEAAAYLAHPVLGPRLRECSDLVNQIVGRSVEQIFGHPDDMKFRSSMTLFREAAPDNAVFDTALTKYFAGEPDQFTLDKLGAKPR